MSDPRENGYDGPCEDIPEEHLGDDCFCESFSDCYKDINGFRPRGIWTCLQVKQWHDEEYMLTDEKTWTPRYMVNMCNCDAYACESGPPKSRPHKPSCPMHKNNRDF